MKRFLGNALEAASNPYSNSGQYIIPGQKPGLEGDCQRLDHPPQRSGDEHPGFRNFVSVESSECETLNSEAVSLLEKSQ
jgi:hypothetical protein